MRKIVRKIGYQIQFEISNKILAIKKKNLDLFQSYFTDAMANFKGNHLVTDTEIKFLFFYIL